MDKILERLDSLLDHDPFADLDGSLLSANDLELLEKYRVKSREDRQRIRNERKTKKFEDIMEDLLKELAVKPDLSSFYRTLDEAPGTSTSIHHDVRTMNSDTSNDEQDDLDHCPTKSIGHSISTNELENSTRVVYPLSKSPQRKILRYTDQSRRNTYTLDEDSPSTDEEKVSAVPLNRANEYLRLNSEGFDPQQSDHLFHHVTDARSTFSIPKSSRKLTRQEAERLLQRKLAALIKGHLTRQLFRTDHVKRLLQTLRETRKFAVDFQSQCFQTKTKLDPEDIRNIDQLIKQVEAVLNEIHAIFIEYSPARRIAMILRQAQHDNMQTVRMHHRMTKTIQRPIIDPLPTADTSQPRPTASHQRTEPMRRHVTTVRPLTKTSSTQRKSRPTTETTLPQRSSSATVRPPPRLAPSSPLFRTRPK